MRALLRDYLDNPRDVDELLGRAHAARSTVRGLIDQIEAGTAARPRLRTLWLEPIEASIVRLSRGARLQAGASWCAAVVSPFEQLRHKYPFRRDGSDASLEEVADFFRPRSGALWSFFEAELQRDIRRSGQAFVFEQRLGGDISRTYAPTLPSYLKQAHAVSQGLFGDANDEPELTVEVRVRAPRTVRSVELTYDGNTLSWRGGETSHWVRARWPGPKRGAGATLTLVDADQVKDTLRAYGDWSLFKLLETATLSPGSAPGTVTARWPAHSPQAEIEVDVRGVRHGDLAVCRQGQLLGLLRAPGLVPPAAMINGASPCR